MSQDWFFPFCLKPPDFVIDWGSLLARFDWLRALEDCPQDPIHHQEGDVLTHTRMVAEALVADKTWRQLEATDRSALFAAALFHDIAKPICNWVENGRVKTPGHAQQGARLTQRLLYQDWPPDKPTVPFRVRQQIITLVRHHGFPLWFWDGPDMERTAASISLQVRCEHLALLAQADVLGRYSDDRQELLERIDLFREFCEELQCLDHPREFPSAHSRFLYFRTPSRSLLYEAYDDTRLEVVLLSGLPGAGKDTWIQQNLPNWTVVSLDALRCQMQISPEQNQGPLVTRAKELARDYLRQEKNFVWNATNVTRKMRNGLIDLFVAYNARIRIVYVEAPWPDLLRRNQSRPTPVPVDVIHKLANRLDVPDLTEAHHVTWVTHDD